MSDLRLSIVKNLPYKAFPKPDFSLDFISKSEYINVFYNEYINLN